MLSITQFPRRFPAVNKRPLGSSLARRATQAVTCTWMRQEAALTDESSHMPFSTLRDPPKHVIATKNLSTSSLSSSAVQNACRKNVGSLIPKFTYSRSRSSTASPSTVASEDNTYLYGERSEDWYTTSSSPKNNPNFPGIVDGHLTSLNMPNLATCSRQEMLNYFDNTWALTDALFASLQGEEAFLSAPPHGLRHPLIFYYGHASSFYVNKFLVSGLIEEPVNAHYEHIFEVGVDEMRWDDMSKNEMNWPKVSEVHAYRKTVYKLIRDIIETHPGLNDGHELIDENHPLWALNMTLEHDRIHLETSSMLMQEHPLHFVRKPELLPDYHKTAYRTSVAKHPTVGEDYPANEFIPVQGGQVKIGKPRDYPSYGWDNEYGERTIDAPSCHATRDLISNGQFWNFVADGGYLERSYWSEEGWGWRCFRNTKWPQFWIADGPAGSHQYKLRALFDEIEMQWDWPAQVNYHEAQAFCRWKNLQDGNTQEKFYHVNTEPLHQLMRNGYDKSENIQDDMSLQSLEKNKSVGTQHQRNLSVSHLSFTPVNAFPASDNGFRDVFGNAWEWCEDSFAPLHGFRVHKYYDDFSSPCFDGEHQVIMGGSFISSGDNGSSKFARYHFRPHFFQHASFRLVSQDIDEKHFITLATTDVNAPEPHTKPDPFRTSEQVRVGVTEDERHSYETLVDEVQRRSEMALNAFVQSIGDAGNDESSFLVRGGLAGVQQLRHQVAPGEYLVIIVPDDEVSEIESVLSGEFDKGKVQRVPVFQPEEGQGGVLSAQTAMAWKRKTVA